MKTVVGSGFCFSFAVIFIASLFLNASSFLNIGLNSQWELLAWYIVILASVMASISIMLLAVKCIFALKNKGTVCEKCGKHPVKYDSPSNLCFYCWTEWWVDGLEIEDPIERAMELESVRNVLKDK
jgi:hypothetical protein